MPYLVVGGTVSLLPRSIVSTVLSELFFSEYESKKKKAVDHSCHNERKPQLEYRPWIDSMKASNRSPPSPMSVDSKSRKSSVLTCTT
jgi:hypothetical protein